MKIKLEPCEKSDVESILDWASTHADIFRWSGMTGRPTANDFEQWHADPDVRALVGKLDGTVVAYGELWVDRAEGEIELGRILVHPVHRAVGIGKSFTSLLVEQASNYQLNHVIVRVLPENDVAIRCYESAGFESMSVEQTRLYNREQPREYVWMKYPNE